MPSSAGNGIANATSALACVGHTGTGWARIVAVLRTPVEAGGSVEDFS